jgi:hypothetical protein
MILLHVSEYLNMKYTYRVLYVIKTRLSADFQTYEDLRGIKQQAELEMKIL